MGSVEGAIVVVGAGASVAFGVLAADAIAILSFFDGDRSFNAADEARRLGEGVVFSRAYGTVMDSGDWETVCLLWQASLEDSASRFVFLVAGFPLVKASALLFNCNVEVSFALIGQHLAALVRMRIH